MREEEKELITDLFRLLRRYKGYENPYIQPDGDIVIPLDSFIKKSRTAHSKMADAFKTIMNEDPTFKKKSSTWVE